MASDGVSTAVNAVSMTELEAQDDHCHGDIIRSEVQR